MTKWLNIRGTISAFFDIRDGLWHHKRIDRELQETNDLLDKRRGQTKAAREAKQSRNSTSNSLCNRQPTDTVTERQLQLQEERTSTLPAPSTSPNQPALAKQGAADFLKAEGEQELEAEISALDQRPGTRAEKLAEAVPHHPAPSSPGDRPRDPAVDLIEAFDRGRVAVYGGGRARAYPHHTDLPVARNWLKEGADAALVEAVTRAASGRKLAKGEEPPASLSGVERSISDAIAAAKRPMPAARSGGDGANGAPHPQRMLNNLTVGSPEWKRWREERGLST